MGEVTNIENKLVMGREVEHIHIDGSSITIFPKDLEFCV